MCRTVICALTDVLLPEILGTILDHRERGWESGRSRSIFKFSRRCSNSDDDESRWIAIFKARLEEELPPHYSSYLLQILQVLASSGCHSSRGTFSCRSTSTLHLTVSCVSPTHGLTAHVHMLYTHQAKHDLWAISIGSNHFPFPLFHSRGNYVALHPSFIHARS